MSAQFREGLAPISASQSTATSLAKINQLIYDGAGGGGGGGTGTPAGSDGEIQFNDAGAFGASAALTFDGSGLTVGENGVTRGVLSLRSDGVSPGQLTLYSAAGGLTALNGHGGADFRIVDFPNADGIVVLDTATQALTNKTIDASVIGGTTPAAGTFTQGVFRPAADTQEIIQLRDASDALMLQLGSFSTGGGSTWGTIWGAGTPSGTNYILGSFAGNTRLNAPSTVEIQISNTPLLTGTSNLIEQRNGANPQDLRIYNSHTDTTTFERLNLGWDSNVAIIGTEKGSVGGTARALELQADGTTKITITAAGLVLIDIPTSDPGVPGALYSSAGAVMISL